MLSQPKAVNHSVDLASSGAKEENLKRATALHQQELEQAVSLATMMVGEDNVQSWLMEPSAQWEGRSPFRTVLDGEGQLVLNFLRTRVINERDSEHQEGI